MVEITREEFLDSVGSPIIPDLDKAGLTLEYLVTKLKEELEATQIRIFHYQGSLAESKPQTDWRTRQVARQDAHRLRGDYPAEKWDITGNLPITVVSNIEREAKPGDFKDAETPDDKGSPEMGDI